MKQNKTKNKHLSVRWVAGLASANGATGANSRTTSSPKATAIRSGLPSTRRPATWVTVPNGTPLHGARYTAIPSNYHQPSPPPQKKKYLFYQQSKQTNKTDNFIIAILRMNDPIMLWMDESYSWRISILYRVSFCLFSIFSLLLFSLFVCILVSLSAVFSVRLDFPSF